MPERSHYNQAILTQAQQRDLILAVVGTATWKNGTHKFPSDSAVGLMMEGLKLHPEVYLCISPKMTVYRSDVPYPYRNIDIDIRDFPEGSPSCEHVMIELYWEEGGGGMDSGTPNRYVMCNKCCHHVPESTFEELLSSLPYLNQLRDKVRRCFGI